MKRRRELEMGPEIRSAIDELSIMVLKIKPPPPPPSADGCGGGGGSGGGSDQQLQDTTNTTVAAYIPTKPFLSVCNLVLQVLDKIGPTMAVMRQDIHQNIQRLEKFQEMEPPVYSNVVEILKKEQIEGKARKGPSCSKAFVWLTRSLDFTVTLLQLLVEDFGRNMEQAVDESYNITLKPWHGWISSAAYKVALILVPDTDHFIDVLMAKDENQELLKEEIRAFISLCIPLLEGIHTILKTYGLDRLKCT